MAEYRTPHLRRYLRYVQDTRCNPLGRPFTHLLKDTYGLEPAKDIEKHGQRSKKCLTEKQWDTLRGELMGKDPLDRLLLAYIESPLRVSEFLALPLKDVNKDTVQDGALRRWLKGQARKGAKKVFQVLCPTQRCAYSRLRRRLRDVCEYLSLTADLDTLYKSFHALSEAAAA